MKEQIKTPEKEKNNMETSNLSDAEFKTLVRRIPQQHKKIQLEMKDTLIEIKKNLERNNSRVDEAKSQINDSEYKETNKKKTANENTKKKELKNMRLV